MKKISLIYLCVAFIAIILSSCLKNEGNNNSDKKAVNYDALFVVNRASNSLSVISISSEKVEKTISLGSPGTMMGGSMMGGNSYNNMWPYHISLSPDKSKLAITEPGMDFDGGYGMMRNISSADTAKGKILIIDAVTGDLLKELSLEGMPYDAIFSPDGKEIWTSIMLSPGKVDVFSADAYNLLNSFNVGSMPAGIIFSDDGKKVFVANGMSGTITVIDASAKTILDTIPAQQGAVGAFPGMHGMMFSDNENNQTISIINTMNNMMTDSIRVGFIPGMVCMDSLMNKLWVSDPSGGKIHYWNQNGNAYTYGGSISVGSGAGAIVFSRDGKTCYVTNRNDNSVSVVDVPGLKEKMKIPVGEKPDGLILRYH